MDLAEAFHVALENLSYSELSHDFSYSFTLKVKSCRWIVLQQRYIMILALWKKSFRISSFCEIQFGSTDWDNTEYFFHWMVHLMV